MLEKDFLWLFDIIICWPWLWFCGAGKGIVFFSDWCDSFGMFKGRDLRFMDAYMVKLLFHVLWLWL